MLAEGATKPESEKSDDSTMEEALENDQSLEAKIEREVIRVCNMLEKKLDVKLGGSQDHCVDLIKSLVKQSDDEFAARANQTNMYIQEIHNF